MTKRAAYLIAGEQIAAGTRKTVNIPVSTLSDYTPVTLSAHVIHGRKDGPSVFVSAGIHGDEVIGVEIVRRLLRTGTLKNVAGTLIVVPIVNTFGFLNHSRYLPDRRDLNRCFPGSPHGSLGSRLAQELWLTALLVVIVAVKVRIAVVTGTGGEIVTVVPETAVTCVLPARYRPVTVIPGAMPVASVTIIWVKLA